MKNNHSARTAGKKRFAALIAASIATFALVFIGCGDGGDGGTGEEPRQPDKPGTVQTDVKIYFLNGWEDDIANLTGLTAGVIEGKQKSGVNPTYLNAVIDEQAAKDYENALAIRDSIIELHSQYGKDMEEFLAGDMSGTQPVEPQPIPSEPVAPVPTIPYFPGTAFYNGVTKDDPETTEVEEAGLPIVDTFGENPVLQGYGLLGWELWTDYENTEGLAKNNTKSTLTLATILEPQKTEGKTLSGTYYAVAVWQEIASPDKPAGTPSDAPEPTPYTIIFEKNDGSGESKIGLAFPNKVWFKAADQSGSNATDTQDPKLGYKVTDNSARADNPPQFAKYDDYKLVDAGTGFTATVPVYTRTYWDLDGWLDITEQSKVLKDSSYTPQKTTLTSGSTYNSNTYYYQNYKPKMWTIDFKLGKEDGSDGSLFIAGTLPTQLRLPAPKLVSGGFAAAGLTAIPTATATGTADNEALNSPSNVPADKYTFAAWNSALDYSGQSIGLNTPIQAATKFDANGIPSLDDTEPAYKTLYAQWNIKGTIAFNFSGVNVKEFKVPADATYKVELWGAAGAVGGDTECHEIFNGKGGYISGNVDLKKDEVYYIYLGGKPNNTTNRYRTVGGPGGFNGGALAGEGENTRSAGGKSGGATDIRTVKASSEAAAATDTTSLESRIMVAGGGGGGDGQAWSESRGGNGGVGIARGGNGRGLLLDATDSIGYLENSGGPLKDSDPVLDGYRAKGQGQAGRENKPTNCGNGHLRIGAGAGGGGYYGGASKNLDPSHVVGGGGGSSWANRAATTGAQSKPAVDGYVTTFTITKSGGGTTTRALDVADVYEYSNGADKDGTGKGSWNGAGKVKITYTPPPVAP